jgi:hypothetical protein
MVTGMQSRGRIPPPAGPVSARSGDHPRRLTFDPETVSCEPFLAYRLFSQFRGSKVTISERLPSRCIPEFESISISQPVRLSRRILAILRDAAKNAAKWRGFRALLSSPLTPRRSPATRMGHFWPIVSFRNFGGQRTQSTMATPFVIQLTIFASRAPQATRAQPASASSTSSIDQQRIENTVSP